MPTPGSWRSPAHRPHGPRLRGAGGLELSLSHTGSLLTLALGTSGWPVGADVERATRRVGVEPLARRVCTPYERAVLNATSPAERPLVLLRLWTLKEAYAKGLGVGTRLPFRTFGFRLCARTAVLVDDGATRPAPGMAVHNAPHRRRPSDQRGGRRSSGRLRFPPPEQLGNALGKKSRDFTAT